METINYKILRVNLSNTNIKLIHTPLGIYLKKTFPKYYAKKIPYDCKINISEGVCEIYLSNRFYKKNKMVYFEEENLKPNNNDKKTNKKNVGKRSIQQI